MGKEYTKVGDLITGTVLDKFLGGLSKGAVKGDLVTIVNPTATSYQNISRVSSRAEFTHKAAIPADIWYLKDAGQEFNLFTQKLKDSLEDYLKGQGDEPPAPPPGSGYVPPATPPVTMGFIKQPRNYGDIQGNSSPEKLFLMRFQTVRPGQSFDWAIGEVPEKCCGFLDFVIGPLGVMETLTIAGEVTGGTGEVQVGGLLLPPQPKAPQSAPGLAIVVGGYLSYTGVQTFAEGLVGELPLVLHNWLRVKLLTTYTFPVPGEFLGLLARPFVQFIWYMQKSSPFLWAGNFFETNFYSSGIIDSIEAPNTYKVWIHEKLVSGVKSSDYLEYAVGNRVALLKTYGLPTRGFRWKDLVDGDSSWMIVPITFYRTL
jgi:hypothetical protein